MGQIEDILNGFISFASSTPREFMRRGLNIPYRASMSSTEVKAYFRKIKAPTLRAQLCRMRKLGLVIRGDYGWKITKAGVERVVPKERRPKPDLIVIFDIPEKDRGLRDWLRRCLVDLDFFPIQQSVWFGPSPLPDQLIRDFSEKNIEKCIRYFKVSPDQIV